MDGSLVQSSANGEPQLLFSRPYAPTAFNTETQDGTLDFSDLYFHPIGGTQLAEILRDYNVPRVALTSCHSAYAQADHVSNLCRTLIQHGVEEVTAINFAIRGTAASLYAQGFYTSLLVGENSFTTASAHGREHVRTYYPKKLREMEHEPSALPSVYKRAGDLEQIKSEVRRPRRFLLTWFTLWQWFVIALWASCHTIPYLKVQWDAIGRTAQWIPFSITFITLLRVIVDIKNFYRSAFARRRTWLEVLTGVEQLGTASTNRLQGINMMAVEDILRSNGSAFIEMGYSPMSAEDRSDLQSAMEEWEKTQSVDVTFVDGEQLASGLWYYNYMFKRQFSASKHDLKQRAQQLWATITNTSVEEVGNNFGLAKRSIIVFSDFSFIFEPSTTTMDRDRALKRISNIMERAPNTRRLEFLLIGTAIVPWDSGHIDPDLHPWVKGPRLLAARDLCIYEKP
ncbi:hypothetical protein H9Q74_011853 [Fusarium xylarioides]|nr:hypothetical protein H9Q71_012195 [Fusarium xylarioides]KAG5815152.1 hypothetical protein H9Q74_011853 [Fusarium xylarioides]